MMQRLFIIIILLCLPSAKASQVHFQIENDVTFKEDGNYSNGMILGWQSELEVLNEQQGLSFSTWPSVLLFKQEKAQQAWGLKVSQRMWTPSEIKITEPQPDDRPYAGFLEFEQHTSYYAEQLAQKVWFGLGIIGPASGTEQLQGAIHKLLGASTPEGWQYQIDNTPTIQLSYEIDYLLLRDSAPFNSEWELSGYSYNSLGNFRSEVNAGLTLRWGANLTDSFGRLSAHFGHVGNYTGTLSPQSYFIFSRLQAGYRFNDLTIDGDLPYQSNVEMNAFRASAETGIVYAYSLGTVAWSFNFYNKEYHGDSKKWHGYGLLQFTWAL